MKLRCLFAGITPKLTHEVGLNSELTFKDGKTLNPKGALAAAQKRKLLPGDYLHTHKHTSYIYGLSFC